MTESSAFFALAPRHWSGPNHTRLRKRIMQKEKCEVLRAPGLAILHSVVLHFVVGHSALRIPHYEKPRFGRSNKEIAVNCSNLH